MIKKLNSKNLFVPLILSCISVFSNTYTFAEQVNADGYVTVIGGKQVQPPKLTAEELKKPYSKYFFMPMAKPDQKLVDEVEKGPLDPDKALKLENLNDMLKPGYLDSEIGYTVFPDGTGYVSSIVQMPGVTPEMIDWWFAWHPIEALRYKIWDHNVHYDLSVSDADRKKLLSDNIPWHERNWHITHHVTEDIGVGAGPITISFVSPEEFGFDITQFKEPNAGTAICAQGGAKMLHIARRTKDGVELRTRFWFPAQAKVPMVMLKGLNLHAVEEYSNLAETLPSIYKEYGPK